MPGKPDSFYIINLVAAQFLDTHGAGVSMWGDGVALGGAPQNISLKLKPT